MTDLEKFEKFLSEMDIGYTLLNNMINIDDDFIIKADGAYGNSLDIKFAEDGKFLGFDPYGE